MFCSLSGEIAKDPVISPKSGRIFDKNLIVSYLSTNNKDPISDDPLSVDELVPINHDNGDIIPPKPPGFNSIPSLLSTFQNEFDSMALEIFSLRKQLSKTKQEHSSALYQYDAAVKVAANAIKERDDANSALQQLSLSIGNDVMGQNGHEEDETEQNGQVAVPVEAIDEARQQLFQLHKTQKVSLPVSDSIEISLEEPQTIKKYNHHYFDDRSHKLLVNGGKELLITDLDTNNDTKVSHRGGITAICMVEHNGLVVPVYATKKQVKVEDVTIKFKDVVVGIKSHPKLKNVYVVVCTNSWTLIVDGQKSLTVELDSIATTADFHVDGALFGVGTNSNSLLLYNITDGSLAASMSCDLPVVDKLQFGMNGYWLVASCHDDSQFAVQVFDLRKQTTIHTISLPQLNDFVVDQSSSLILTATDDTLALHRFFKKEKTWTDDYKTYDLGVKNVVLTRFENDTISAIGLGPTTRTFFHLEFK